MVTVDVDRYLARIGYGGDRTPSVDNLPALQLAHLLAVPFENLDVYARAGVRVEREWSLPKIVDRRRGGWCFECNGAFSALLEALGYDVTLHSAQVDQDGLGPPLDHLALVVRVGGRRWLVDVGFGDAPLAPLDIDDPQPQDVLPRAARVALGEGGAWLELFDRRDDAWTRLHRLDLVPRDLAEFAPRSHELEATPGLMWTERRFATKPLADGGRVFLFGDRLRLRSPDGTITETPVAAEDWDDALDRHVGMRR